MIRRNQEMRTERYEHLKGGDGCVELIHIFNEDEMYGMGRFSALHGFCRFLNLRLGGKLLLPALAEGISASRMVMEKCPGMLFLYGWERQSIS